MADFDYTTGEDHQVPVNIEDEMRRSYLDYAMSVITALVIHFTFFPQIPLVHTIIVGIVLSLTGVIGDLAESMWKRSAAVKDSGTLIPGHGGFLDRFDSILYTAPILYVYWALSQHAFSLNIIQG